MTKPEFYEHLDVVNAFHEAGHAVVALLLDNRVGFVALSPPDEDGGFGQTARMAAPDHETELLVKLAGVGAELIYRKMDQDWTSLFTSSGKRDWRELQAHLDSISGHRRAILKAAKAKVMRFLEDNWVWVSAVSQQLREARCLTGAEVAALRPAALAAAPHYEPRTRTW